MKFRILAAAVFALLATGAAKAQENAGPCKADAEKLCKDVKPGEGRIIACLKSHDAELSAECKAKGLELKEKAGGMVEACKGDMEKFCADVKGGHGEKLKCLKDHEKDLSEGCRTKLDAARQEFGKKNPCMAETEKLCPGLKPGDGKFGACLKEHEKDFSETCQADMTKRKEAMMKKNPCMADMEKFCKDVKPGEGRLIKCLKEHEAELSDACKAKQAEMKEHGGRKGPQRGGMGQGPGDKPEPPAGDAKP